MKDHNQTRHLKVIALLLGILAAFLAGCATEAANTPIPTETLTAQPPTISSPAFTLQATLQPEQPQGPPPVIDAGRGTPRDTELALPFTVVPLPKDTMVNATPVSHPESPFIARLFELARKDLSERLMVSIDEIEILAFEAVIWPDASLGCPQPGMEYIQVQREGYRITLGYAGQEFVYHGGGDQPPFLCENK
jgi:hypothetical protein